MKYLLSIILIIFLTGCATKIKYVEKQSEELSQAVYGTKDSINVARIDLAERYINQASRLVAPPKNRVNVEAIVKSKNEKETERVLILPNSNKKEGMQRIDKLIRILFSIFKRTFLKFKFIIVKTIEKRDTNCKIEDNL